MNISFRNLFSSSKKPWLYAAASFILMLFIAVALVYYFVLRPKPSPVPTAIKQQVDFKVLYPGGYDIVADSWKYTRSQGSLTFIVRKDDYTTTFTEQKVPLVFQDDAAAYNRFIGSLRPAANFKTRLGMVSLTNFVTTTDFQQAGQGGLLNTNGTLLVAHPSHNLSDEDWRKLFDSLTIDN
jgi:hypothetical protein